MCLNLSKAARHFTSGASPPSDVNSQFFYIICDRRCTYRNVIRASNLACALSRSPTMHSTSILLCLTPSVFASPVQSVLLLHKLEDGSFVKNFPLDMGSITGYSGRRKDTEIFYSFTSFLTPGIIYRCDMTGEELKPSVRYL